MAEADLRAFRVLLAVFGRLDLPVCGLMACSAPSAVYAR